MLKLLKWIVVTLTALVAALLVGGYVLSPKFSVVRSVTIAAPADKVYALISDPREWTRWSVWNQRDPAMQVTYSGPPSGAGAVWAWQSKSQGDGKMTFTAAESNGQQSAVPLDVAVQ
jgi:Polyketide cyclase / dehydrase and lipid transport